MKKNSLLIFTVALWGRYHYYSKFNNGEIMLLKLLKLDELKIKLWGRGSVYQLSVQNACFQH